MNLRIVYYLVTLIIVGQLMACNSMYMPNVPATPMFQNQGQVHVAGHVNLKGNISGTLGVALTDEIAILANGSTVEHGANSNLHFKQWLTEGAIGYYSRFGDQKNRVVEVYAGYGIGSSEKYEQRASVTGWDITESRLMDFDKYFVQLNYSSTKKDKVKLFGGKQSLNYGTAIRLSRVGMKSFLLDDVNAPNEENYFIEPLFFTRLGLKNGFQLQYTNGFNISLMDNNHLKAGNAVFTLGLVYNFGIK